MSIVGAVAVMSEDPPSPAGSGHLPPGAVAFDLRPQRATPGAEVTLWPPAGQDWKSPNFSLDEDPGEERAPESVHTGFLLHGGDKPMWIRVGTDVGVLETKQPAPGPIRVVIPEFAEPGSYIVCGTYGNDRTACSPIEIQS